MHKTYIINANGLNFNSVLIFSFVLRLFRYFSVVASSEPQRRNGISQVAVRAAVVLIQY